MNIARDVDDGEGFKLDELFEEKLVAAFSRRLYFSEARSNLTHIDNNTALLPTKALRRQPSENVLGLSTKPPRLVSKVVDLCILLRRSDTQGVDLHSSHFFEMLTQRNPKQSRAAVSVDQMGGFELVRDPSGEHGILDIRGERDQDRVVVLEERSSGKSEQLVPHSLVDSLFMVGDDDVLVLWYEWG